MMVPPRPNKNPPPATQLVLKSATQGAPTAAPSSALCIHPQPDVEGPDSGDDYDDDRCAMVEEEMKIYSAE